MLSIDTSPQPWISFIVLRELKGRHHHRGFSMLFITHDSHLARKVEDRVYVLKNSIVVE